MRTPLTWLNLQQHKARLAVTALGLSLATTLLFVHLGIFHGMTHNAVRLYSALDFDLALVSSRYSWQLEPDRFSVRRLHYLRRYDAIDSVEPVRVRSGLFRNIQEGTSHFTLIVGIDPNADTFREAELNERASLVRDDRSLLMDSLSMNVYGDWGVGSRPEVIGQRCRIVGDLEIGPGIVAPGLAVVSHQTYDQLFGRENVGTATLGLIRLADRADPERVAALMNADLPKDVRVLTRTDLEHRERHHLLFVRPVGVIFGSNVVIALALAVIVIYQVLCTEVSNRLREFATIHALGYSLGFVRGVVLRQTAFILVVSFIPAVTVSVLLYKVLEEMSRMPIVMTAERLLFVASLLAGTSFLAALAATTRLRRLEPAELF
ncbi:FtsX-like permease family protein [Planctomycetes bacterium Pan216]|uniref:FtsX-like permease family protein n=1 Tax=Kolteria novifilia TaxID=2527975 RepID=A0A518B7V7_9BACT|nr:FtsX-like permease family protein [Planctomycetes bacterium Pan216]